MIDQNLPAYAMVQINMKNPVDFMERYAQHVLPLLQRWGVEMIAGSMTPITKEGDFAGNWVAILKFANMEAAEAWYNSDEYKPYLELRLGELTDFTSLVFVEGMQVAGSAA